MLLMHLHIIIKMQIISNYVIITIIRKLAHFRIINLFTLYICHIFILLIKN